MAELTEKLLLELSKKDSLSSLDLAKTLATDHQVIRLARTSQCE